jgi:hypothetical protein
MCDSTSCLEVWCVIDVLLFSELAFGFTSLYLHRSYFMRLAHDADVDN